MSWIVGVLGINKKFIKEKIFQIVPKSLFEFEDNDFFITAGGSEKTCFFSSSDSTVNKYVAVGLGIQTSGDQNGILNSKMWAEIHDSVQTQCLNGHFILLRWDQNGIKMFTDVLGLRDVYYSKNSDQTIIFSTRADWVAKIINTGLDFKKFGSRWLLFNQISTDSIYENITRISSGIGITINRANLQIIETKKKWLPVERDKGYSIKNFSDTLARLCILPFQNDKKISISLSGGMDSRVILSYLMNNRNINWYAHTFGEKEHPDAVIADKICSKLAIDHEHVNLPFPQTIDCIKDIKEYVSHTLVNNAASGFIQLRNYNVLENRDEIIIDGGFGEIWRREFFNRLLIMSKNALLSRNANEIIPFLRIYRADIFNEDINKLMLDGCEEQINNLFYELPEMNKIGIDNFVDLFAIKTRLANYYSYEQSRLDTLVSSYMPFVQPILLENIYNIGLDQRRNGRLFKKIIGENYPILKKIPLAKGQITHPFWLNTIQSRIWNKIYKKSGLKIYNDNNQRKLIDLLRPYILDTIYSASVKECGYYDIQKLNMLAKSLRKNAISNLDIHEIDWWLAFELFRQDAIQLKT